MRKLQVLIEKTLEDLAAKV